MKFFADQLEVPIIDHWWQTETGWPMSSQVLGMDQDHVSGTFPGIKFGSVSRPVPGYDIQLMSPESGEEDEHYNYNAEPGTDQELVVKLPLPPGLEAIHAGLHLSPDDCCSLNDILNGAIYDPGTLTTLYNNDEEFHAKYLQKFPGYYHTGDTGHIDEDGYVYVSVSTPMKPGLAFLPPLISSLLHLCRLCLERTM